MKRSGPEGPFTRNPLAFQWYDSEAAIGDKKMKDIFRFSVVWWHTFRNTAGDPFGRANKEFPWLKDTDGRGNKLTPMEIARNTVDAAFEFFTKLGAPYHAFHDRDIAPEAYKADGTLDVDRTEKNLWEIVNYIKQKQEETGVKLLWGTASLFGHPMYAQGAATNPNFDVLLHAAAQVKAMLEVTKFLGGENYVLWGGREGYYSLINTRTKTERDNLGQFLRLVRDHAKKIGFTGKLLIEPKPHEPTGHQYDHDVAAVLSFLREYGLFDDYYLNVEANHATLAGMSFQHELQVAADAGRLGSIDANSGGPLIGMPRLGWDVDLPPSLFDAIEAMLVVYNMGGFTTGGVNFDMKTHRTSTDLKDIFKSHILGMDSFAQGCIVAKSFLEDPEVQKILEGIYASQSGPSAVAFRKGKTSLEQLAAMAKKKGEPKQRSGKLEFLYHKLQQHMFTACHNHLAANSH